MEVVIGYHGRNKEQLFNHVNEIDHSSVDGITLYFEGPDGKAYGDTTISGYHKGARPYVKSVDKEDHEE